MPHHSFCADMFNTYPPLWITFLKFLAMQSNEKYLCLKKDFGGIEIVIISAFLRTLQL